MTLLKSIYLKFERKGQSSGVNTDEKKNMLIEDYI